MRKKTSFKNKYFFTSCFLLTFLMNLLIAYPNANSNKSVLAIPSISSTKRTTSIFLKTKVEITNSDLNLVELTTCSDISKLVVAPKIGVTGNGVSIINGSTNPNSANGTNFGTILMGANSITTTFTINNAGDTNLKLTGTPLVEISGSSNFTVVAIPTTLISRNLSTTFKIQFTPSEPGIKTARITIPNNGSASGSFIFDIIIEVNAAFYDSDFDGVLDNLDIDDDNDGILDLIEEINCNKSNGTKVNYKFLNETFGSGPTTTINTTYNSISTYCYEDGKGGINNMQCPSLIDYSLNDGEYSVGKSAQIASWANEFWYKGGDHTGTVDGRMAMFNADIMPRIFYTATVTGALPGIPITYSFWVLNLDRSNAPLINLRLRPNIKVDFVDNNNNLLKTINTGNIAPTTAGNLSGDWYQFTANLLLNVSDFKVIFKNNTVGGSGNDLALDDIVISQTLCDLDQDGVADMFDLDADNDGIADVIEVGLGNWSSGKGIMDVAWIDANGNGVHDSAEATAALPAMDSDGDGIPNYLDLDSDNDSIFDVDESGAGNSNAVTGFINGDGDINGDGVGDGLESETFRSKDTNGDGITEGFGDGILDIYDYGTGVTNQYGNLGQGIANMNFPAATYLKDTNNDGIPDYLDLKSDGINFDITNNKLIYDYKVFDTDNDGKIDGTQDIDKDGILDLFDTNTAVFGSPRDLRSKLYLDFDGRNDYAESTTVLSGKPEASLMAWVDLNSNFTTDGVVLGERNFQIKISSGKQLQVILNGSTLAFSTIPTLVPPFPFTSTTLNTKQWYHVGATYNGTTLKLFLNGNLVASSNKTGVISTDISKLTIGKNPGSQDSFFKGKIDEVRVFNVSLTDSQLQRMVYQEIDATKAQMTGVTIPKSIAETTETALPFTNMIRYYRMDTYKGDEINDLTNTSINLNRTTLYNHKGIFSQEAPMPFETLTTGNFATAVDNPIKDIRGRDVIDSNYSIIKVKHDIIETSNTINLGMFVDPGKTIIMNNDTKIQNDWYLKLDGKIDLQGMSQLVQTSHSDLDVTSDGFIERDQQGQSNNYNYNYWSSPVSPKNTTANNTNYTIGGVMKDGTTGTPRDISWISGYDGSPTTPVSLANYWLYKFDNYSNANANWVRVGQSGALRVGQGYTLKGSGASTNLQNYTFIGKPNNGLITTNSVSQNQLLLTGNPYPSALDSRAFIEDNLNIAGSNTSDAIDGALYFWEHYSSNYTHVLRDYQGGYAVRNLLGGVAPSSANIEFISKAGTPSRGIPSQFIPVGQAFFVAGNPSSVNSTINFKNSQRAFIKEIETASNVLYKVKEANKKEPWKTNNSDVVPKDTIKKIRLGFNSRDDYHKQLLLGFVDGKATDAIDYGYDATSFDNLPNDIYFYTDAWKLIIQGVGSFDSGMSYPIGVKTDAIGKVKFLIDELENFDPSQAIYIYDGETATYHDIRVDPYEVNLAAGENQTRFSLRFTDNTLAVKEVVPATTNDLAVSYQKENNTLTIHRHLIDVAINKITLINMMGQSISSWEINNHNQEDIVLPVTRISTGVYVVKIKTVQGEVSKKIVIK